MKKENTKQTFEVELTRELYLEVSTDKATKISALRDKKDFIIAEIEKNIKELRALSEALEATKVEIRTTKAALRANKNTKWSLSRELSKQNKFAKRINKAYINGEETINLSKFYTSEEYDLEKKCDIELTKELYTKIATDKVSKITYLKAERDNIIAEIDRNLEKLDTLNNEVNTLNGKITFTENALSANKNKKWVLSRELSKQKKFARRINKAYTRGDKSVDITKFYTLEEQKTR